jgi:hypothetical protein
MVVAVVAVLLVEVEAVILRRLEEEGECIHSMQGRKQDCSHQFLGMSANIRNRNTGTCIHSHHRCLGEHEYSYLATVVEHMNKEEVEAVVEEQKMVD